MYFPLSRFGDLLLIADRDGERTGSRGTETASEATEKLRAGGERIVSTGQASPPGFWVNASFAGNKRSRGRRRRYGSGIRKPTGPAIVTHGMRC